MLAVPEPKTREEQEREFRTFIRKLLDAQRFEPRAKEPFSLRNLRRTFIAFCDIIADELETESCTIHLQLYDPASLNAEELKTNIKDQLDKIGEKHGFRPPEKEPKGDPQTQREWESFERSRRPLLKSSATFPYWLYPKGASVLFASNPLGPWTKVALTRQHGVAPLDTGISKDIYQQNIARIRDQLSIQSTRDFRKLGGADPYAWTNTSWEEIFRNYYGVPIRIYSLGEAIGILKVENKRHAKGSIEAIQEATTVEDFKKGILDYFASNAAKPGADPQCSLLSLVYLLEDLATAECNEALKEFRPGELILLPFPHITYRKEAAAKDDSIDLAYQEAVGKGRLERYLGVAAEKFARLAEDQDEPKTVALYESLRPSDSKQRPPVQILAESMAEERKLWQQLKIVPDPDQFGAPKSAKALSELADSLQKLYRAVTSQLTEVFPIDQEILFRTTIEGFKRSVNFSCEEKQYTLAITRAPEDKLPCFIFRLELLCDRLAEGVRLLAMVVPSPSEVLGAKSGYQLGNEWWCNGENSICTSLQNVTNHYKGEQVWRRKEKHLGDQSPRTMEEQYIPSFAVDRLAARSQAFSRALVTAEFTEADTRKLSWAALEIGKVLEREIANRANYLPEPIPLTAMEFYRIPISHLGFVDDLQRRRQKSEVVEDDVRRRLRQALLDFGWQESVRVGSRIKDYRSYLTRLGERYEGFIRGNMALGLFLLGLQLHKRVDNGKSGQDRRQAESEGQAEADRNGQSKAQKARPAERVAFLNDLETLKGAVLEVLVALCGTDKKNRFLAFFPENRVLGDFRFRTAPISLREKHWSEALDICIGNLCKEGCLQGEQHNLSGDLTPWKEALKSLVSRGSVGESLKSYRKELESLLFRRYDAFAQATYSLLCQLANCLFCSDSTGAEGNHRAAQEGYLSFYRTCYDLKARLSLSTRAMEEEPELSRLKEFFAGEAWTRLVELVDSRETTEFVEIIGDEMAGDDVLFLNPRGLYKRVRMMHHVLRLHISPSSLEWALGRFDLVGCRATALFKHQVFAVAEYLWNRGDPFFDVRLDAKDFAEFYGPKTWVTAPPWLCLRTKVFEKEYQAVHLAALVDPATVGEQVIRKRVYSPRRLRKYLGLRLWTWEEEFAKKYRNYAYHRDRMRLEYTQGAESGNSGSTTPPGEEIGRPTLPFLFEGVTEVLIRVLREIESTQRCAAELEEAVRELLQALVDVLGWAEAYTTDLRMRLVQENGLLRVRFDCTKHAKSILCQSCQSSGWGGRDDRAWLQPRTCQIYSRAQALLGKIGNREGREEDPDGSLAREGLERYLDQERSYFEGLRAGDRVTPLLFVPPPDTTKSNEGSGRPAGSSLLQELKDLLGNAQAEQKEQGRLPPTEKWADLLIRLQRQYTAFFFEQSSAPEQASLPDADRSPGALWLRDAGEVLGRIENYVLLFSPDQLLKKREPHAEQPNESNSPPPDPGELAGWTAYDLFHYFHSLIPVEIQVRTQLANTVAEQYHEPLYKGQPGLAAELGGRRVKNLSRQLGDWDREMDRVYLGVQRQAQVTPSPGKKPGKGQGTEEDHD